jgi:general secretion pathway protein I
MNRPSPTARDAGFTLIEVIVAMFVIAIGIGALLTTLVNSADSISRLRDRSFAGWIALNRISETRLAQTAPSAGASSGEVEFAGGTWLWRQEVLDEDVAGVLRINVSVARASSQNKSVADSDQAFPALAKASGFYGTEVGAPSGNDPSWAPIEAAPGGGGGDGGADGAGGPAGGRGGGTPGTGAEAP